MKKLFNTVDGRVLKEKMMQSNERRITISFYKYHRIDDPSAFRDQLFEFWDSIGVMGRTYVASEGINAQISVPESNFDAFKNHLYSIPFLNGNRLNVAFEDNGKSFYKLKVKLRNKIVADGIEDPQFDPSNTGNYLKAEEFNRITDDPNTILIDMRNHYESEVGHFENAILPDADTFREEISMVEEMLQGQQEKNVVMYCTGGIRCEKASAYLKHKGFQNVHHLEGGIIKYAQDVKAEGLKNKFKGVNFVFDERLSERISDDVLAVCHQCGKPCDSHTNCANEGCHVLFIQCDECKTNFNNCCSAECKEIIALPAEVQKELRKGKPAKRNIFQKGRSQKLNFNPHGEKVEVKSEK